MEFEKAPYMPNSIAYCGPAASPGDLWTSWNPDPIILAGRVGGADDLDQFVLGFRLDPPVGGAADAQGGVVGEQFSQGAPRRWPHRAP